MSWKRAIARKTQWFRPRAQSFAPIRREELRALLASMSDDELRRLLAARESEPGPAVQAVARADIIDAFIAHFSSLHTTRRSDFTTEELTRAEELVRDKFLTPEWTHRVP